MQISNDWFVAETEFENKSLTIRGRLFLDAIRQSGKFATRIALVWEYQGDEKGMPTEKETQALDSLNEKLRDILEEKEIAILTAIHIGGKTARYEYYGISAEKFSIVLNETFSEYPPLPIKIGAESDPEWNNYIETIQQFAMQP